MEAFASNLYPPSKVYKTVRVYKTVLMEIVQRYHCIKKHYSLKPLKAVDIKTETTSLKTLPYFTRSLFTHEKSCPLQVDKFYLVELDRRGKNGLLIYDDPNMMNTTVNNSIENIEHDNSEKYLHH